MLEQINNLPDDTASLQSIIITLNSKYNTLDAGYKTLQENHESKIRYYEDEIRYLNEKIRLLSFKLFGRKFEKLSPEDELQGRLFNEAEACADEKQAVKEEKIKVAPHERRKRGRRPIPEAIPRVNIIHDLSEEEKICACGEAMEKIGEEISEKLDIIPPKAQVNRHIRMKYACKKCEGLADEEEGAVKTAPMPPQMIEQGIVSEGLLAYVITSKFADALPFYRQSKIFSRIGMDVSRATLCAWTLKAYEKTEALVDLMWKNLDKYQVVGVDETTVQVLDEPGRDNTAKSYMWAFRGEGTDKPLVLFSYSPSRSAKEMLSKHLDGYKGYIQSDGFESYDYAEKLSEWIHVGCWAHTRRKFFEAVKASGGTGISQSIIDRIRKLYAIEEKARNDNLSYDEIKELRKEESKPIIDAIKTTLDREVHHVPPKSLLGKAVRYALNEWNKLIVFLDDGRIPIDNNIVENSIRPFAVGRKNWLFSGSPGGAIASAGFFSLIETARANGFEPYWYLRYIFERLPYAKSEEDMLALLPFFIDKDKFGQFVKGCG
jgi:transposase